MAKNSVKLMAVLIVLLFIGFAIVSAGLTSPTLELYPKIGTNDTSLICYERNNETTYEPYITSLTNLLQGYNRPENVEICDHQKPSEGIHCDINMKNFGLCGLDEFKFGYRRTSPCVFLKIKLNNLKLEYYNYTESPPTGMPNELARYFKSFKNEEEAKKLYISCQGLDPASLEHIGPVEFYPANSISDKFLHNEAKDYAEPLIAFRLIRPTLGVLIDVECRMWAKNIDPEKNILQFGVLID